MALRTVYLSVGSNVGDRKGALDQAIGALEQEQIRVVERSSTYETEPQDVRDQPWFLNMVVRCETRFFPLQLLTILLRIERELGRKRTRATKRGPRIIDLDVLLVGNTIMHTAELDLPHPRMLERRFVLEPLIEIAPELRHPETRELFSSYLGRVAGQKIRKVPT
ncbi:MAG: 2-amino-4-hydroxy-6-hydroxymethyldihydropteridine diphosphokinase [Acidobacteriaceae bacterium]|nr:2-amino-4-hydroxy-6-hydroxymethyldihydropteridine diphosphokinase [Acidobacteriaceae bacterium]